MKYYDLCITTNQYDTYQKVSNLLNVIPKTEKNDFSLWTYQVVVNEESDKYFDFINAFLDLLEPNFEQLLRFGIQKQDILIWFFYEYDHQCSMSFSSQEMKRLGESGISFNIDCIKKQ